MKVFQWLDKHLEHVGMCITFVLMFCVVLLGIISRAIGKPISWTEEASRLAFVWMIFLGLSYGTTYDKHIRITILTDKMGPKVSAGFTIFWDIMTIIVFIWIGIFGWKYVLYSAHSRTFALQLNKGVVASIVPISAMLNIFRNVQKMLKVHIPEFCSIGKEHKITK